MIVYYLSGTDFPGQTYRTLREARAAAKSIGRSDYYIEKCKLRKPTVESMLEVINAQGGSWCEETLEVVEATGCYAEKA